MKRDTKIVIGGAMVVGSILLLAITFRKSKQPSFPLVSSSGNLIVRNYFGQSGFLSQLYPRGIRNNNPGNIKLSNSSWLGKIAHQNNTDGIFEQFSTFEYGLRAMIKQVKTDIDKGHNSIAKLISKYAPSKENPTENYIKYVAAQTGIDRNAGLVSTKTALRNLVKAMVRFENGQNYPVSDIQFEEAYKLL